MLVTVSIGVAAFQGRGDSGPAMLKRADQALYRAKAEGRNRVELDAGESNAEGHASAAPLPGTTPGRTARIG